MNVPLIKTRSRQSQSRCNTLINTAFIFLNGGGCKECRKNHSFILSYFALCQSEVVDKTEVKMLTLNCMTLFTNEKYNILP